MKHVLGFILTAIALALFVLIFQAIVAIPDRDLSDTYLLALFTASMFIIGALTLKNHRT